jgi:putative glycosyltransferase (TIGR04372 family)
MRNSIFSKLSLIARLIIFFPAVCIIVLINPFFKIKIFEIETRIIGHFSKPLEIFLCELENRIHNSKCLFLWVPNKIISNKFLLKKWKEIIFIVPEFIFYPIFMFFKYLKFNNFLTPYRHWTTHYKFIIGSKKRDHLWQNFDRYNVLIKTGPRIILNYEELNKGNDYLKNKNLEHNQKFVCIFSRDPFFHLDPTRGMFSDSSRDSSILDHIIAMKYLSKKNYKIFRMGSTFGEKLPFINKNIIDYAKSKFKSDFLDIFLLMQCHFAVGSSSGIMDIPLLNRKKILLVNLAHIHTLPYYDIPFCPFFIPKKFKSLATGELIPYYKVFEKKLYLIDNVNNLRKNGFDIENNSKLEILESTIEMDEYISNGKKDNNKEYHYLIKKFNNTFFKFFNYRLKNINICKNFIINNQYLIT